MQFVLASHCPVWSLHFQKLENQKISGNFLALLTVLQVSFLFITVMTREGPPVTISEGI